MKTHNNQRGSALIWVLCIFMFLFLTSVALLTASVSANLVAAKQVSGQQAYFTARSAAASTAQSIIKDPSLAATLLGKSNMAPNQATKAAVGDFKVSVNSIDDHHIKVIANCTRAQGESSTVVAYMEQNKIKMDENVFYIASGLNFNMNKYSIIGNICLKGSLEAKNGNKLDLAGNTYTSGHTDPNFNPGYTNTHFDESDFTAIPEINDPVSTDIINTNTPAFYTGTTITGSGIFPTALNNSIITVDTSSSDITLVVNKDTTINGITVYGDHNLILWLEGSTTLTLSDTVSPNPPYQSGIFVLGNDASTINLVKCDFTGYIYLPNGTFWLTKDADAKTIKGWVIARNADVGKGGGTGNATISYQKAPSLPAALQGINFGTNIYSSSWSVSRWSNK